MDILFNQQDNQCRTCKYNLITPCPEDKVEKIVDYLEFEEGIPYSDKSRRKFSHNMYCPSWVENEEGT